VLYCLAVYCRKTIQRNVAAADEDVGTQYKTIQHTIAAVCCIASKCITARQYNILLQQLTRMRAPLFGGVSRVYISIWPCVALRRTVLWRLKVLCSVLQRLTRKRTPILCSRSRVCVSLLHCVATCCSELQWFVVSCSGWRGIRHLFWAAGLECMSVCCSVLQRVAVFCGISERLTRMLRPILGSRSRMYFVFLHSSVLCCSVLQCDATSCSMVQYVAVCCSFSWQLTGMWSPFLVAVFVVYMWGWLSNCETYRVVQTHRMPYLYRSFSAKEPYNSWLFCEKWPATWSILWVFATLYVWCIRQRFIIIIRVYVYMCVCV